MFEPCNECGYGPNGIMMFPEQCPEDCVVRWVKDRALDINHLDTEEDLVKVIDELKYKLKTSNLSRSNALRSALDSALNEIILEFHLDGNKDYWAKLPE